MYEVRYGKWGAQLRNAAPISAPAVLLWVVQYLVWASFTSNLLIRQFVYEWKFGTSQFGGSVTSPSGLRP